MKGSRICDRRSSERGTALLAALCFATVLAISLGSYMTMCYRSLALSSRSMQGARSAELAEAGIEDALWTLNKNNWSGWTITGTTATKTLAGFSFGGGSTGTVQLKVTNFDGSAPGARTVTVTSTVEQPGSEPVTRTVSSSAQRASLFVNAVAGTTSSVRFFSGGSVDSYDSRLGDYSAQTPGYSAVLSSGSTWLAAGPVQLGNAQVKGYATLLDTVPKYGTGARLLGPDTPATTKVDLTRVSTNPYQPVFDEATPTGSGALLPSGSTTVGTAGATAPTLYYTTNLQLAGTDVLTVDGPTVIVASGDFSIADAARIVINATGSLRIHLTGNLTIGGGGIQNDTKQAKNFVLISTKKSYETYAMATNTDFYGVIYAPNSRLTVSNNQAIYGSLVAMSVTFEQSPSIHYDLALRDVVFDGVDTPFAIAGWRETTNDA